jgi:mycothiol system anti-sigma-R factor
MGKGCSESIEQIYHYLDGELTEEVRIVIKRHLDDCPPCLQAFDFEAELRLVIANRCKDRVPDALRQRIHDALIEAEKERHPTGS